MLAQCNIPGHIAFSKTPRKLLKMERRLPHVINYIKSFATSHLADILCLQEVDRYKSFYEKELRKIGYDGQIYKQRSSGTKVWKDGCLIAYCKKRFEVFRTHHLEFNEIAANARDVGLSESYLKRENVAALCSFRDLNNGEVILVVNVHLFWDPDCVDIKLLQATMLLRKINEVVASCADIVAVLVCGDFNSTPDCAAFKLLTSGKLDLALSDCLSLSPATVSYIKNMLIGCSAVPRLSSAYHVADDIKSDTVSTVTDRFSGLIDHILYARLNSTNKRAHLEKMVSLSTLSLPTLKEIEEVGIHALPSRECPSDHLPIAATLNFTAKDDLSEIGMCSSDDEIRYS